MQEPAVMAGFLEEAGLAGNGHPERWTPCDSMPSRAVFTGVQIQNKEEIVSWLFQMHLPQEA